MTCILPLVAALFLPICLARTYCENDHSVGLKPTVPDHLGALCHEFSDIINEMENNHAVNGINGEEVRIGKHIMHRTTYREIPDPNYKLRLISELKTADGRITITSKVFLSERYIKVCETTYFNSLDDTQRITNQRILQFGYGSAPDNLKATVCNCTDKKVKANFLAKIKEWYPDADITCDHKKL